MRALDILIARREYLVLALMLESLHLSIWAGFGSPLSRSLMLMHLGLFLLWQPVWRGDQKISWNNLAIFTVLMAGFIAWMSWWLLFAWLTLLIGFCAGRAAMAYTERGVYVVVLIFLVLQLVMPCTTMLFRIEVDPGAEDILQWLLLGLPLLIVIPSPRPEERATSVDILHAISGATLVTLMIAGSLLIMYRTGAQYPEALLQTIAGIAVFLFAISWLLTPRFGFSGLTQLWQRAISNIGTPFEHWLTQLSDLFRRPGTPQEFLDAAMDELVELPWIAGVKFQAGDAGDTKGEETNHTAEFKFDSLRVIIFSHRPLGAALYFHCRLLVHLVDQYYVAKLQERELTRRTHLQAIYETGARVTHDIKNLLQSLQAVTSIVQNDEAGDYSVSGRLLRGQLPHLTQRLQLALEKLQAPAETRSDEIFLKDWWHDLRRRTQQQNIQFQYDVSGDPLIPPDLFDSVVENLLENIREKIQVESALQVTISLFGDAHMIQLSVCDDGRRIPDHKAQRLLHEPLDSPGGLGIGLYQAARQAEALGYTLALAHNADGRVCFELRTAAVAQPRGRVA